MFRVNKRFILLIIFVLVIGVLTGCSTPPKAPEGVDQEFYDDMIIILEKLEKTKGELDTDNGKKELEEYLENKLLLKDREADIVEAIDDLHFWVWFNNNKDKKELKDNLRLKDEIYKVSDLMGIDIGSKFKIN